ncbi:MAG: GntR family transcriptional regulator [Chloroflexota bacterium]
MRLRINQESSISLRKQLVNQLRHLILSGQWFAGDRIPSEPELQRQLQISRGTIRQALRDAEAEGLIVRIAGKGTFVSQCPSEKELNHLIGYITCSLSNEFQSQLLNGAESTARKRGYRLIFCNSNQSVHEEERLLSQMLDDKVRGLLIWPTLAGQTFERLADFINNSAMPLTILDRTAKKLQCDYVTSDNYQGGFAATSHLIDEGHHHIAFLSSPILTCLPVSERYRGYRDALAQHQLTELEPWLIGDPGRDLRFSYVLKTCRDGTSPEIDQIATKLKQSRQPTAIFAINDLLALKALKACEKLGLQVPEDVAIIGFDNQTEITTGFGVPLSTVAQDTYQIGKRAAELLIARIEGYNGPPQGENIPVHTIIRQSTQTVPTRFNAKLVS